MVWDPNWVGRTLGTPLRFIAVFYGVGAILVIALLGGDPRFCKNSAPTQSGTESDVLDCYPVVQYGTLDDIANVALFLASSESSFVTGHLLVADGGSTLQHVEALVVPSARGRWRSSVLVPQQITPPSQPFCATPKGDVHGESDRARDSVREPCARREMR